MTEQGLSLYELNTLVRDTIEGEMNQEYWVRAELSEIRENRGHCYMELVETRGPRVESRGSRVKERESLRTSPSTLHEPIVARASAKCWKNTWTIVRPHFERVTGQPMRAGMQVLLKVYPQFHELFGFSWIVTDVNPEFTMGDMARKRQEIINRLKEEGVFDLQKSLSLPMFCQNIAVISSASAAGYGDFVNQLENNPYGFQFNITLFPATMQGDQMEQSIIAALEKIYFEYSEYSASLDSRPSTLDQFDCVVIIRGGGATTDLSGFDTLALAENVANFPLPVITGIGHERDESILDMISYRREKTPTAVAAFLIQHLLDIDSFLNDAQERIIRNVSQRMELERQRLGTLTLQLPLLIKGSLMKAAHRLDMLEQRAVSADPARLLQRGYSITTHNGKIVRDAKELNPGDIIETRLAEGSIITLVKESKEGSPQSLQREGLPT